MGDVAEFRGGWSISRLADEFGMARETVGKRLREAAVAPTGKRSGHDVFGLAAAAAALVGRVVPEGGVDPRELPPLERRAFYQSENERLKVEMTTGSLVPAAEVESDYASLVKTIAQFFDTLPDVLERDCALTGEQVVRVQEACDRVRQTMYEKVLDDGLRESA